MDAGRIITKKAIKGVCLAVDIYMLALIAAQYAFYLASSALAAIIPEIWDAAELFDGLISCCAVIFGCIIIWTFAAWNAEQSGQNISVPGCTFKRERRMPVSSFAAYAAMIFMCQIIFSVILVALESALNLFGMTISESPALNADYTLSPSLFLYAVIIGPAAEEFVFRGVLLKGLKPFGKVFAITVSAVCFSLMHGDIEQILFTFAVGVILAYTAMEYSIFASFLLHIFNNGIISELMMFLYKVMPEAVYAVLELLLVIVCFAVTVWFVVKNINFPAEYIKENRTSE
ncbi:MAG: CPBP family intramembrane metalloprotease, partial [Eubacteriales bacterium]|nr:CPBP family intramembrane metalloprotease [Eubacteriales bacterium]